MKKSLQPAETEKVICWKCKSEFDAKVTVSEWGHRLKPMRCPKCLGTHGVNVNEDSLSERKWDPMSDA